MSRRDNGGRIRAVLSASHFGAWAGPNRLWMEDPSQPERSDGQIELDDAGLRYRWTFRGEAQTGEMTFAGVDAALHIRWKDTFHAADGMELYGTHRAGFFRLITTYGAGDGPEWGWTVELDLRDPEHVSLRMFNVPPGHDPMIAVDLYASRAG